MAETLPSTEARMKLLQQVNRRLIAAEKKARRARERVQQAEEELADARRSVKRALDALQPELPVVGVFPPVSASDDGPRG
jgi:hypothetical protein